ncbi:MAG: DUF4129 domain-containing protein [Paludibacteraceae bacterium]|nr:DUF4129 domain-containing protein [Paludibacteraceae bacterium]
MRKLLWIIILLSISSFPSWAEEYDELVEDVPIDETDMLSDSLKVMDDSLDEEDDTDIYSESSYLDSLYGKDSVMTYEKVKESIDNELASYGPGTKLKKIELKERGESPFRKIADWIAEFISSIDSGAIIIIIVVILAIIATICGTVIFRNRSYRKKQEAMENNLGQSNLLNGDEDFELMMKKGDYKEAIRIIYVRTLALLNNKEIIHWERSKTPSEYYYEVKSKSVKAPFKNLTHAFLLARYDNIEVSREMVEEALVFEKEVIAAVK